MPAAGRLHIRGQDETEISRPSYVPGLNTALAPYYKPIALLVGIIARFFGVYEFVVAGASAPNTFSLTNLERLADNLLHLIVGVWALAAALRPAGASRLAQEGSR